MPNHCCFTFKRKHKTNSGCSQELIRETLYAQKVKVINRVEEDYTKEKASDIRQQFSNYDPAVHPQEKAKEYVRALNAAKLTRVFAKPFLAALTHSEQINCLARSQKSLNGLLSGTANGTICLWDITAKRCIRKLIGHSKSVTGISYTPDGTCAVSSSIDCTARLWKIPYAPFEPGSIIGTSECIMEYAGKYGYRGIDHHPRDSQFVTCGDSLQVWDHNRTAPLASHQWGSDTVTSVKYNPVEAELVGSTSSDRGIILYDLRASTPIKKLIMQTRSNALSWNPIEAMNFVVANEDCCLYTYDLRKLKDATCVHKDFTSAVMDVDFAPTGRDFVAGSYDKTVRLFTYNAGHSRDVYHTGRMQRVLSVKYSGDASYVFSGSQDMNIRVWKANASDQLGPMKPGQRRKHNYDKALIQQYGHLPAIKRIVRHRHLPKSLYAEKKVRREQEDAIKKRLDNLVAHSKAGSVKVKKLTKRKIVNLE